MRMADERPAAKGDDGIKFAGDPLAGERVSTMSAKRAVRRPVVRADLLLREPGDGLRCPRSGFAFFKCACTRGTYGNMITAVEAIFIDQPRA